MKAELFSTLKQSVEILQNEMKKEDEPVWLGTLWNVDQSLAKMAEKYLAAEREKQFDLLDKIAARIKELEEALSIAVEHVDSHFYPTQKQKFQQLLNQKP